MSNQDLDGVPNTETDLNGQAICLSKSCNQFDEINVNAEFGGEDIDSASQTYYNLSGDDMTRSDDSLSFKDALDEFQLSVKVKLSDESVILSETFNKDDPPTSVPFKVIDYDCLMKEDIPQHINNTSIQPSDVNNLTSVNNFNANDQTMIQNETFNKENDSIKQIFDITNHSSLDDNVLQPNNTTFAEPSFDADTTYVDNFHQKDQTIVQNECFKTSDATIHDCAVINNPFDNVRFLESNLAQPSSVFETDNVDRFDNSIIEFNEALDDSATSFLIPTTNGNSKSSFAFADLSFPNINFIESKSLLSILLHNLTKNQFVGNNHLGYSKKSVMQNPSNIAVVTSTPLSNKNDFVIRNHSVLDVYVTSSLIPSTSQHVNNETFDTFPQPQPLSDPIVNSNSTNERDFIKARSVTPDSLNSVESFKAEKDESLLERVRPSVNLNLIEDKQVFKRKPVGNVLLKPQHIIRSQNLTSANLVKRSSVASSDCQSVETGSVSSEPMSDPISRSSTRSGTPDYNKLPIQKCAEIKSSNHLSKLKQPSSKLSKPSGIKQFSVVQERRASADTTNNATVPLPKNQVQRTSQKAQNCLNESNNKARRNVTVGVSCPIDVEKPVKSTVVSENKNFGFKKRIQKQLPIENEKSSTRPLNPPVLSKTDPVLSPVTATGHNNPLSRTFDREEMQLLKSVTNDNNNVIDIDIEENSPSVGIDTENNNISAESRIYVIAKLEEENLKKEAHGIASSRSSAVPRLPSKLARPKGIPTSVRR